ncbi:hypothetical protein OG978_19525 [Streptomyces sp. NBC_01591]|uniref:hypothetical protein n=1 Tax=Streptomyces sp. NBC_01591 TaxID=2975888 RepID=UPI002DDB35F3|nr:hypothetical protein [Streptomyces sp. NBC_01591]WSD69392.1 hypothetical protein OG978_19525 [Streptomyces sp. NBC_01591]
MEAGPVGRAVRAAMFAAVSVTLAATGHVLMSEAPIPFWVLATGFLALAVPGWWFAARERGPWLVTGLAVATQGVLHNAFAAAQSALGTIGGTVTRTATTTSPTRFLYDNLSSTDGDSTEYGGTGSYEAGAGAAPTDAMAGMHHVAGMDHSAAGGAMTGMEHMAGMDHASAMGHMGSMVHLGHDMAGMSSTGMLAAHVLAALVCGLWLARGERAAFQVLRAVAGWLLTPLHPLLTAPLPTPRRRLRPHRGLSDRLPLGLRCARARDRRGPPGVLAAF